MLITPRRDKKGYSPAVITNKKLALTVFREKCSRLSFTPQNTPFFFLNLGSFLLSRSNFDFTFSGTKTVRQLYRISS